jgi:predicted transposase YbfD/YdcC
LSVYDVEQAKVMTQVEVGRKENEITKASKALQMVEIAQKVVTGDAMHTQRGLATQILEAQGDYVLPVKENQPQLYKNIQALFAPEYPKPGFGKIQTDFLTTQKVNKGHGRIETRTLTTSEMLNAYAAFWHRSIVWSAIFNGGAMDAATALPVKWNSALLACLAQKRARLAYSRPAALTGATTPVYIIAAMSPSKKMLFV